VSEQNVQQVRDAYEALSRREVEALLELLHPDVEYRNPDYAMEAGTRQGRDAFRRALEANWEVLEDLTWEIEQIVDDGDTIVVTGRMRGRGRSGGVPFDQPFGHVLELEDDRAISMSWFRHPEEALEAARIRDR